MTLHGSQVEVSNEFASLGDYIWKLPRFLDSERELELQKLYEYFPDSDEPECNARNSTLRQLRFAHEFEKILLDFPAYMGSSCLIQVMSLTEMWALRICKEFEEIAGESLENFRGKKRGLARLLEYVRKVSGERVAVRFAQQIGCATLLRNCVVHAGGLIAESRDERRIRANLRQKLYYPAETRGTPADEKYDRHPRLAGSPSGDRLFIPMLYVHWLACAAREMLIGICKEAAWPPDA